MTMFFAMAVGCSVLIGGYALLGLLKQKLYINGATATLLLLLGFVATAGGEFVREGVRKPFTIRHQLYSNAIRPDHVAHLRQHGSVTDDPYPLRNAASLPTAQLQLGAKVFRLQCLICHTPDGVNGLTHLTGSWTLDMKRQNIARLQRLKPFMPPFAGSPDELEAIAQWISWTNAGRPSQWGDTTLDADYPALREQLRTWLDEVGVQPMSPNPGGGEQSPAVRISRAKWTGGAEETP
jgi:mono/diheme cytochrome c family protein